MQVTARMNIRPKRYWMRCTILDRRPTLEGLRVAIIGDIAHSRVARSNIFLFPSSARKLFCAGRPRCCRERWPTSRQAWN